MCYWVSTPVVVYPVPCRSTILLILFCLPVLPIPGAGVSILVDVDVSTRPVYLIRLLKILTLVLN